MADEKGLSLTDEQAAAVGASLVSAGVGQPLVPTTFEGAWRLSKLFVMGRMVPKSYLGGTMEENVAAVFTAIQYGLSVGLDPATSLQCIASINGVPGLHSMGPLGVVRRSSKFESIKEWLEGSIKDGNLTAYCEAKRKGEAEPVRVSFTMEQAKRARLWGKSGPWSDYPEDMMAYKARNRALKRVFPDVLMGAGIADDRDFVEAEVIAIDGKPAPEAGQQDGARLPKRGAAPRQEAPVVDVPAKAAVTEKPKPEAPKVAAEAPKPKPQEPPADGIPGAPAPTELPWT